MSVFVRTVAMRFASLDEYYRPWRQVVTTALILNISAANGHHEHLVTIVRMERAVPGTCSLHSYSKFARKPIQESFNSRTLIRRHVSEYLPQL